MAGTIVSGTYTSFISLYNPAAQRPVTVTGKITNASGQGIVGNAAFAWTIDNSGTIEGNGTTSGFGIQLLDGGTVNNAANGLITGYSEGILIEFAAGTVSNLGRIESTGSSGNGVDLTAGGSIVNGSASHTTASITGGRHAVLTEGGTGTVANFGTISKTAGAGGAIVLFAGGSVTNGSKASTAALISNTGAGSGVYINYGAGTITNFATIEGATAGVALFAGGRVTNGASGSTRGLITGATDAILIAGSAAAVANFGTVQASGTDAVVAFDAGGALTNGASGATSALITGNGNSFYATDAPGTVTNFGTMLQTSGTLGSTVSFRDGGSVANFGKIESAGTSAAGIYLLGGGAVTNGTPSATSATIGAAHSGIAVRGGSASITNFGSIEGTTNIGVYLQVGGNVANQAKGLISGSLYGIELCSGTGTVSNLGSIVATGNPGHGVALLDGGDIVNGRSGSTAGFITGISDGVYLKLNGGVVTNFGTIRGAIGFNGFGGGDNTLIDYGTVVGTAGVAVEMGSVVGLANLLVVEKGAVFNGLVEGGGRGEIEFAATGVAAMGANISGFATVALANGGADSLTLADANFSGVLSDRITVLGGNAGNTVNASTVTAGVLTIEGGAGKDVLTGANNGGTIFVFTAATLTASDKITGSGFNNELDMTTAGTVAAGGVSAVQIYRLADGGANKLVLTNANFTGLLANTINVYGGDGGNTIDGSKLTGAGDNLAIYGGAGTDVLKGGAGNDIFVMGGTTLSGDTISGGGGNDELQMTTAGTVAAAKVSGVETYVLGDGSANTLGLTTANFTGVAGGAITVSDGNAGNTVSVAASVPGSDHIVVYAGSGTDKLTGGAGGDVFFAGGKTVMTGGAGANQFTFSAAGSNTVADFAASETNMLMFVSGAGFSLPGASATAQQLGSLFSTGAFTKSTQRFAYSGGKLFYSATGSISNEKLVATLTGSPTLDPAHLLFMS